MASLTDVPESVPARITRLSKEVAEAGHVLDGSRRALDNANHINAECHARFTHLSEELYAAIQEHREGGAAPQISAAPTSPENAPYQP